MTNKRTDGVTWTIGRDKTTVRFGDFPEVAFGVNDIDDVVRAYQLSRRWRWEVPLARGLRPLGLGL